MKEGNDDALYKVKNEVTKEKKYKCMEKTTIQGIKMSIK